VWHAKTSITTLSRLRIVEPAVAGQGRERLFAMIARRRRGYASSGADENTDASLRYRPLTPKIVAWLHRKILGQKGVTYTLAAYYAA
jgi:hypothetical protein